MYKQAEVNKGEWHMYTVLDTAKVGYVEFICLAGAHL